jgi:hypothetical protein
VCLFHTICRQVIRSKDVWIVMYNLKIGPSSIPIGLVKSGVRYGLALLASNLKQEFVQVVSVL